MKISKLWLLACFFSAQLLAANTGPAEVKVTWQNPDKYTDIRPSSGSKKAYQKRVISGFDKIWADLAEKLPAGYTLKLNIKDVDLAGDVNPMYRIDHNEIRVIKEIYFPKVTLDYELLDASHRVVAAENDVKIKDMGFMMSSSIGYGNREFVYEYEMLKKWFNKTILASLVEAN